jgi:teichuronic acid biosynthesis glycosyltransferase TuaC
MINTERRLRSHKVLSVCTNFPTRNRPTHGLFVGRRLSELSQLVELHMLVPQAYFPVLRPRPADSPLNGTDFPVTIQKMFYLPGIAKHWDGRWMERVVSAWIGRVANLDPTSTLIDAHFGYPEGVGCYRVAKKLGIPLFVTVRGLETELMAFPNIKSQMLEAYRYATGIISVSESLKEMLIEHGVEPKKIKVIGNGVESEIYCPGNKANSRSELGVDISTKLIVALGNVQRRKGYDLLIEAIACYRDVSEFQCVILGGINESATMASLKARIEELGLKNRVRFTGQATPDVVVRWLRAADMFVLPTRREGCCNAVLEALSTGVPVISTPAGDNTKFVSDGRNGFIVPHEDPKALQIAIQRSWDYPWDLKAISESVHRYTWKGAAEQVVEYFQERLDAPR